LNGRASLFTICAGWRKCSVKVLGKERRMAFVDTVKEKLARLEKKHYYMLGGAVLAIIIIIILLSALSSFPGQRFGDYRHYGPVAHIVFEPNGSRLATSELNTQSRVIVWDISSGKMLQTLDGNARDTQMMAFTSDGELLVTAGPDERVNYWGLGTGGKRNDMTVPFSHACAMSPNGDWLAYSKSTKTYIYNLKSKEEKEYHVFDGSAQDAKTIVFGPDSTLLAAGDQAGEIYQPREKIRKVPQKGHEDAITCLAFSPDGSVIGTASRDKTAKLWDKEGKQLALLEGHEDSVETIVLGQEGRIVLTGSRDKTARLWNGQVGQMLFKLENFQGATDSLIAISMDGKLAAIQTAGAGIEVFETAAGKSLVKIEVPVSSFAFSPRGNKLFFGRPNGKLYTWSRGSE
jgi:WD40 repeat protein